MLFWKILFVPTHRSNRCQCEHHVFSCCSNRSRPYCKSTPANAHLQKIHNRSLQLCHRKIACSDPIGHSVQRPMWLACTKYWINIGGTISTKTYFTIVHCDECILLLILKSCIRRVYIIFSLTLWNGKLFKIPNVVHFSIDFWPFLTIFQIRLCQTIFSFDKWLSFASVRLFEPAVRISYLKKAQKRFM